MKTPFEGAKDTLDAFPDQLVNLIMNETLSTGHYKHVHAGKEADDDPG